jgi:hypothetical protein
MRESYNTPERAYRPAKAGGLVLLFTRVLHQPDDMAPLARFQGDRLT